MVWAVLLFALVWVLLYVAFDTMLPRTLRERRRHPNADTAHETEDALPHRSTWKPQ
jgi:hypothetical protein